MSAVDDGREALGFIKGRKAYSRVSDAMDALEAAFGRFGFEHIIVTGLESGAATSSRWCLRSAGRRNGCTPRGTNFDPVIRMCRQNPFEWAEALRDAEREPGAVEAMNWRCTQARGRQT
jgi:LuxR family transcriptional regulator, quorum-sensing system regulator BjaR1